MKRLEILRLLDARLLFLSSALPIVALSLWISSRFQISVLNASLFCLALIGLGILAFISLKRSPASATSSGARFHLGMVAPSNIFTSRKPFEIFPTSFRHMLITGITGSGKSTFIRRLIEQILKTNHRFLYIDFKGERADYAEILSICRHYGIESELQIFDLSKPETCLPFNPLTLFDDIEETVGFIMSLFFDEDSHPYYKAEAERFLRCSLRLFDAAKMPRSLINVEALFQNPDLRAALLHAAKENCASTSNFIKYFEIEFESLSAQSRNEKLSGFLSALSPLTSPPLATVFNAEEKGALIFNRLFSDNLPAIIRVPGESYGDLSVRIIQAFVKMLPVLIARRREEVNRKDYFLLLDEGCSYVTKTLSDLCKKAGSAQVKIVLTRMCDADFETVAPGFLGQMMSSFSVFICFQTMCPDTRETLSRLSMTTVDTKVTKRLISSEETGDGSSREVQRFTIHPTEFGRLRVGEYYVIAPMLNLFQKVEGLPPEVIL